MSFYKIKYSKPAEKFIKKNKAIGLRFFKAFEELAEDNENVKSYDVKKFYSKTYDDIFRLRIGDYRAVFRIIDNELLVYVFDIGSRGDIYKKLSVWLWEWDNIKIMENSTIDDNNKQNWQLNLKKLRENGMSCQLKLLKNI